MGNAWMIRSGGKGSALDLFETGLVGIEFGMNQNLSGLKVGAIRKTFIEKNPNLSKHEAGGAIGALDKIVNVMKPGDGIITYDPGSRVYWVGKVTGDYYFEGETSDLPHRRSVTWDDKSVSRDDLLPSTRNSLGGPNTLIQLSSEVWQEIKAVQGGQKLAPELLAEETKEELQQDKKSLQEQARERLKDRIVNLQPSEMEELLAALLRALGFRTNVSPTGPDRGVDVLASPDGLGLQEPRIKAEVKHRKNTQIGAPDVRSFIGALRAGDRGIYLSTGGFTREARYEADRSNMPLNLMDLEDFARLIETHYEAFDTGGKGLLPLIRIYWPAD
jgi:restriction system protein